MSEWRLFKQSFSLAITFFVFVLVQLSFSTFSYLCEKAGYQLRQIKNSAIKLALANSAYFSVGGLSARAATNHKFLKHCESVTNTNDCIKFEQIQNISLVVERPMKVTFDTAEQRTRVSKEYQILRKAIVSKVNFLSFSKVNVLSIFLD